MDTHSLINANDVASFKPTLKDEYPKLRYVEIKAVMARTLPQILELFEILGSLRRAPPGTMPNYRVWQDSIFATDEAGILMRVAQTSLITKSDIIPNINGTMTYVIDSGMSFKNLQTTGNRVFVTNLEITVHIPFSEEIDIHCFETNSSILVKWDTCFKFSKVQDQEGFYKVQLPGFHALDKDCINKLKLIFTAKLPKHLPINVLLSYDYVFLRRELSETVHFILKRYSCVRVNGDLGLKVIPHEQNRRPELFVINNNPDLPTNKVFGHEGMHSLHKFFSATKYKPFDDEEREKHYWHLTSLKMKGGTSHVDNNSNLPPENGQPDICGVSYMFSDNREELTLPEKIIVMCLRKVDPIKDNNNTNHHEEKQPEDSSEVDSDHEDNGIVFTLKSVYEQAVDNDTSDPDEITRVTAAKVAVDENYAITGPPDLDVHSDEFQTELLEYERYFDPLTTTTRKFKLILTAKTNKMIDKMNVSSKDRLKQQTRHYINKYLPDYHNRELSYKNLCHLILTSIFNNRPERLLKSVRMIKQPETFWDLSSFDTTFSEDYDDDFGCDKKEGWMLHCT